MDELTDQLFSLMTPDMKAELENSMPEHDTGIQSKSLRRMPPDPMAEKGPSLDHNNEYPLAGLEKNLKKLQNVKPRFPPLEKLPCANVQVEQYTICENPGTSACSACKLVSYCSKACQSAHWKTHKRACKNQMRSEDWVPIWIVEKRPPSFISNDPGTFQDEFQRMRNEELSVGCALWGNTPAMDVINLAYNEKDATRDFSLAFVASGDLRHVVSTINALPSNFSGVLDILVNDLTTPVFCRNIILLLILGTISDEKIAVDVALHFWYSAFIPAEYHLRISVALILFLKHDLPVFPLGPHSTLSSWISPNAKEYFRHLTSSSSISINDAQDEYDRVRTAPSRCDYRDRMYVGLRPSHRVAFLGYRRFGIVLPFGAMNAHFNSPNLSLFSPDVKWLQTDYADPLEGWDISVIVEVGKAYGAHPEDIYGCLYFFISEQLRIFAQRLRTFKINFKLFDFEACKLSEAIRDNLFAEYGIPASTRFDRIAVSNILDVNYVGMRGVLTHWAPLLAESSTAVIVGYFMNWVALQEDGRVAGADESVARKITKCLMGKIKARGKMRNFGDMTTMMYMLLGDMDALYENSKPFSAFLLKQGIKNILREMKLVLREKHTIVPHRDMVSLKAPLNALPEFRDDEIWYYHTKLSCNSWSSRYVEFSRK